MCYQIHIHFSTCPCMCDEGGTSFKTQAKIAHCAAFGIKQSVVPAYVLDEDTGKPVKHGVVDRCYNRFRACIQHYCILKQEDIYMCPMCACVDDACCTGASCGDLYMGISRLTAQRAIARCTYAMQCLMCAGAMHSLSLIHI